MPLSLEALSVFPLFPVKEGACTCRAGAACERPGKHPLFLWSQLESGEKWLGPSGCGYGIATGTRSGFFAVDLDVRLDRNGMAAFQNMGDCNETYAVRTPTGGLHLYFQLPDFLVRTSGNELAPGIDIRGEGGFVVAQDSPHQNGGVYTVALDVPIAPAPPWLLAWAGLRGSIRNARDASANAPIPKSNEWLDSEAGAAHVAKAIEFLEDAPVAIDGAGGSVCLLRICIELVRGLELPLELAFRLLCSYYNDRCQPPWSVQELMHKLESARDQCDRIQGKPPEDWTARIERMAMPTVMAEAARFDLPDLDVATEGARPRQRVHNPAHVYTFIPGVHPAAADMSKRVSSEISFILASNEAWRGVLAFNEMTERITAVDPPLQLDAEEGSLSDLDVDRIRAYLQAQGVAASVEDVRTGIYLSAHRCRVHPIKDYLESCRGKGRDLLGTAATVIFGTQEPHANDFFRKMMIAAVRRMLQPGCQVDTMITLVGPEEGEGKSSFCKVLFGDDYVKSQMPDLSTERASHGLKGFWCVEMGELARLSAAQRDVVWEFIPRRVDDYHAPYGREDVHRKRSCIFIGTTNDLQFLTDAGVNRRFWPITTGDIDLVWLRDHRDALWGEAIALAEANAPHWYTKSEWTEIAKDLIGFKCQDVWHNVIEDALHGRQRVRMSDVFEFMGVGSDIMKLDGRAQRRMADTLRRIGCKQIKSDGRMIWVVPAALAALPPMNAAQRFAQNVRDLNKSN